jgi:dihydroneopterin aldolase
MELSHEYRIASTWSVQHKAGDPIAAVRVKNLSTTVHAAQDAWGRESTTTLKPQPLLVSAEVSFRAPFETAASNDRLGTDTVHYGNLSKTVLDSLSVFSAPVSVAGAGGDGSKASRPPSLRDVLETVWIRLTGKLIDGRAGDYPEFRRLDAAAKTETASAPSTASPSTEGNRNSGNDQAKKPFLNLERVRYLSVTLTLPKGSLLGECVSLTASAAFEPAAYGVTMVEQFGLALRLHGLRVPTLVGVNAHERRARQFVIAGVEIDRFDYQPDVYPVLESLVVKVGRRTLCPQSSSHIFPVSAALAMPLGMLPGRDRLSLCRPAFRC